MWKPNQPGSNTPSTPDPVRPSAPAPSFEASPTRPAAVGGGTAASAVPSGEQATIGKSLIVKGELTGSESLYIDGKVEGAINLPGNRVTVGRNGQVAANIVDVNRGATATGLASAQVFASAKSLASDSNRLQIEVRKFVELVRSA